MTAEQAEKHDQFEIVVNGTELRVDNEVVSFEQVVSIAYPTPPTPDTIFSVTYEKAKSRPHDGDLVAGNSVEVRKNGTEFDVTPTGRS